MTLPTLDSRSAEILKHVVEAYLETQEPLGSVTLSKKLGLKLSAATIRNVMSDLETAGFLFSPHTSAGRLPTEAGLRFFLNGFLEFGTLSPQEEQFFEDRSQMVGKNFPQVMEEVILSLSGLSQCAGVVTAPKLETPLKHMEFVWLGPGRAMVVLISDEGMVENRILEIHPSLEAHHLQEASNYLNHRLAGKKLPEARLLIEKELQDHQAQLDKMAAEVVSKGLAVWSGDREKHSLIVRGQSNLLKSVRDMEELDKIQSLFTALDTKEAFLDLLNATIDADGVQIFIGSESPLFHVSGCTVVVAPYTNEKGLLGAIGVIGPIHMNYRRIIPMVDYTARLLGRILGA